ncbi:Mov34/MPN/PAD-1 family protein [Hymenobacter lucidus]|uniref:Mov34/MPN/PAD-1 family protein n=1 Tax=Hymenobacter lucidus TaxID=2880930 RepID=A0ABS8AY50_9BACT|nr:Mov34/MPN/PAD-1 family protein [Hymenobacter lucidus]MCB2410741.1 Mov34/MPN/PAD-1 family protein [Hymenobacter lucidus]
MSTTSTSSAGLSGLTRIELPRNLAEDALAHLKRAGRDGLEGVALWAGQRDGNTFRIQRTIIPEQDATRTEQGLLYVVSGVELRRINQELYEAGLMLVAQIHSHPSRAYHSETDDAYPIVTVLGGVSVVVPDFGRKGVNLTTWEVYRLQPGRDWAHLSSFAKTSLIYLVDEAPRRPFRWYWPWR